MNKKIVELNEKHKISRKRLTFKSRENRVTLREVNSSHKTIAYQRVAILRHYHFELHKREKSETKAEVMEKVLGLLNSGLLLSEGLTIKHVSRSAIYNWGEAYRSGGLAALVPRYKAKPSTEPAIFHPLPAYTEIKILGPPRRRGKKEFLCQLRPQWKGFPLACPVRLSIFYSMPIPKETKMRRRMEMLKGRISHTIPPTLDCLNAFVVDCLTGVVFKNHSQIICFHSEKKYKWWPVHTRIFIRALSR